MSYKTSPAKDPEIIMINPNGSIDMIYNENLPILQLGKKIQGKRVSHVDIGSDGKWRADLSPVNGPILGPFTLRSEAINAEIAWLKEEMIKNPNRLSDFLTKELGKE